MNIKFFLLFLSFFAITPNLGFFTLPAFLIISFIIFIFIFSIVFPNNKYIRPLLNNQEINPLYFFILLFFSALYYGGLYQNKESLSLGNFIFFGLIFFIFIYQYLLNKRKYALSVIIIIYLCLAFWTLMNSPKPTVDTIVVFKEAPLKIINGINPYSSNFSKVYQNIEPNYYNYLPFSFIYMLPFVLIFNDPRYGVIVANLVSVFVLYKLISKYKNQKITNLFIMAFLFLPRSFYMLEHSYMDPIIFSFFLLSVYFFIIKKIKFSLLSLSLFFSFRQTLFLLLPIVFLQKKIRKFITFRNAVFFLSPFLLIFVFIVIDPKAFSDDTVFNLSSKKITSPIGISLTLPTFLINFISKNVNQAHLIGYLFLAASYLLLLFNKIPLITKIVMALFFINFGLYHAFFNSYYFITQFLLLDIVFDHFDIKLES